jgi:CheY-like chemotaxis protein
MNKKSNRVFIIDDEPAILRTLKMQLQRLGCFVETANSGIEAIQKLKRTSFDLIITDIKMPGISGEQVLEFAKSSYDSTIPVVGISGTPWLLSHSDFDAILPKPFTKKDLGLTLSKVLNQGALGPWSK